MYNQTMNYYSVQILLSINVRKQNLATAYKLVYKVAREAENDKCFLNSDTLELIINSIGGACPVNDSEALGKEDTDTSSVASYFSAFKLYNLYDTVTLIFIFRRELFLTFFHP